MTCKECKNYEACDAQMKILIEIAGWPDEPQLCTYVEIICKRFDKKEVSRSENTL